MKHYLHDEPQKTVDALHTLCGCRLGALALCDGEYLPLETTSDVDLVTCSFCKEHIDVRGLLVRSEVEAWRAKYL